jgi:hypothetical protein
MISNHKRRKVVCQFMRKLSPARNVEKVASVKFTSGAKRQLRMTERIRPHDTEEARILIDYALANMNFEEAERLYEDLQNLELLEEEHDLSTLVVGYFDQNQALSNQLDTNCTKFNQRQDEALRVLETEFRKKFNALKKKQEAEAKRLLAQWKTARESGSGGIEEDFQRQIETARLIARDHKYKKAIEIRDDALLTKVKALGSSNTSIDGHFHRMFTGMKERHQTELETLTLSRDADRGILELQTSEGKKEALDCFQIDNADNVVQIAKQFRPTRKMPYALRMQCAHGKAQPKKEGVPEARSPHFSERQTGLKRGIAPLSPPKAKAKPASRSRTSFGSKASQTSKTEM